MPGTAGRLLPAERIRPGQALSFAILLMRSGLVTLLFTGGPATPLFGASAGFWYNGLYTHSKSRKAFAAIAGTLIAAIFPAIVQTTGAGSVADPRLAALCSFFTI